MSNLSTDCLGKTPLTKDAVQVIYDLREDNRPPAVLQTWIKNLCLSRERLRAELAGAEHLWQQAQAVVDRLVERADRVREDYNHRRINGDESEQMKFIREEMWSLEQILGDYQ